MWMKSVRFASIVVLAVGALAVAQTTNESPPKAAPTEGAQSRPAFDHGAGRLRDINAQLNTLDEALSLDENQKKAISDLLTAQQDRLRDIRDRFRRSPEEMEAWKQIQEEMRAAVKANDKARIEELKNRSISLHEAREAKLGPARAEMENSQQRLHDEIAKTLRPEQKAKFETVWEEQLVPRSFRKGPVRNPRALKAIVDRLKDLSDDQKSQIKALFEAFQNDRNNEKTASTNDGSKTRTADGRGVEMRRRSRADRDRLEKLFNDVINVLTPEQKASVEEHLKGHDGRGVRKIGRRGSDRPTGDGESDSSGSPAKGG